MSDIKKDSHPTGTNKNKEPSSSGDNWIVSDFLNPEKVAKGPHLQLGPEKELRRLRLFREIVESFYEQKVLKGDPEVATIRKQVANINTAIAKAEAISSQLLLEKMERHERKTEEIVPDDKTAHITVKEAARRRRVTEHQIYEDIRKGKYQRAGPGKVNLKSFRRFMGDDV